MLVIRCSIFLMLLFPLGMAADPLVDSLLALPAALRTTAVFNYLENRLPEDSLLRMTTAQRLEKEFTRLRARPEMRQAWLYQRFFRLSRYHATDGKGPEIMEEAIVQAQREDWHEIVAEALIMKGQAHFWLGQSVAGFENMHRGYRMMEEKGLFSNPATYIALIMLGDALYTFKDYEEAHAVFRRMVEDPQALASGALGYSALNTAAMSYQKVMKYDSATIVFDLAREAAATAGRSFWVTLIDGNMGHNYYLKGDYERAIPLVRADFEESRRIGEMGSAANAALSLASMALRQGRNDEAVTYVDFARHHARLFNPQQRSIFYEVSFQLASQSGDLRLAVAYADTFHSYRDSLLMNTQREEARRVRERIASERYAAQLQSLRQARDRQVLLRNGLAILFLLSGVIIYLYVNRMLLKQRKEKELARLQTRMAEDELDAAKRELGRITRAMREKNDLIDSFRAEIAALQDSGVPISDERTRYLDQLLHATILTEEDWQAFRALFDKVHPGFSTRLREKIPDLTPADTRLLTLTKLGLSSREMAAMLGISTEAIKKTRYRLRKKIDLPEEGGLEELVQMI
jgi:tetratricopeptide (TPR) repeat protein/DNA-directed RNA polymerase specialized sigma24 family protein